MSDEKEVAAGVATANLVAVRELIKDAMEFTRRKCGGTLLPIDEVYNEWVNSKIEIRSARMDDRCWPDCS
jgi:hypothetical protein